MKKSKIVAVGLIVLLLIASILLGCTWTKCPGDGECDVAKDSSGYAYRNNSCRNGDCAANNVSSGSSRRCSCTI
jgi:hypothetical protein